MSRTPIADAPKYSKLLAQIEWLENGKQKPSLRVELNDLLAALADAQGAGRKREKIA